MDWTSAIGAASSFILVLTIGKQVFKQYKEGKSEGVSKWLFLGQMTASGGFLLYSWLKRDWVFIATNGIMLVNGLAGYLIVLHHRKNEKKGDGNTESDTNTDTTHGTLKAESA